MQPRTKRCAVNYLEDEANHPDSRHIYKHLVRENDVHLLHGYYSRGDVM